MIYKVYTENNYINISAQALLKQTWEATCDDVFEYKSIKCYRTIPKAIEHIGYNRIIKLNNENVFDMINEIQYVDSNLLGDLEIKKRSLFNNNSNWNTQINAVVVGFDDKFYRSQKLLYVPNEEYNLDEVYIKSNAKAYEVIKIIIKDIDINSKDEQVVDIDIIDRASLSNKYKEKPVWFSTVACTL